MATRFYLPSSPAAGPSINASSGWNNPGFTNGANTHPLVRTKSNTALTDRTVTEAVVSVVNTAVRAYLSEMLAAQAISGTFSAVIRGLESTAAADNSLQVIIRVLSSDCATVRATLYSGHVAALNTTAGALGQEFGTTQSTRIFSAVALSSYTCVDGDRLSVEVGYRAHNTSTTSMSSTLRLGDPSATADFALTAGLTTDLCPWVELSADLSFYTLPATAGDSAPATDSVAQTAATARSAGDTAGSTDVAASVLSLTRPASDSAAAADVVARAALSLARTAADSAPALDAATRGLALSRLAGDSAPVSDTAGRTEAAGRQAGDSAPAADTAGGMMLIARATADSAPSADIAGRSLLLGRTATDAAPASDTATRSGTAGRTVGDDAPATDAAGGALLLVRPASDTTALVDAAGRAYQASRSALDSAPATDAAEATVTQELRTPGRGWADRPHLGGSVNRGHRSGAEVIVR